MVLCGLSWGWGPSATGACPPSLPRPVGGVYHPLLGKKWPERAIDPAAIDLYLAIARSTYVGRRRRFPHAPAMTDQRKGKTVVRRRHYRLLLHRFSARSRLLSLALGAFLASTLLQSIPVVWSAEQDLENEVVIVDPPPPPPPLPEELREQVQAWEPVGEVDPTVWTPDLSGDPQDALAELAGDLTERSEGANIYEVNGATHLIQSFSGPVNYLDESGQWVPISTELVPDGEGGLENEANAFSTDFPAELSPASPIEVVLDDGIYTVAPEGILPTDFVTEAADSLTYLQVLPGIDLTYNATSSGYKEVITADTLLALATPIVFELQATGLVLRQELTGEISILAGEGSEEVVALIPAPIALDSSVDPETGNPDEGEATQVLTDLGGGTYLLELSVDPAFAAGATYPVMIDPGEVTLGPSRDAYVDEQAPSTSYESSEEIRVGKLVSSYTRYGFLQFAIDPYKRAGRTVIASQLSLWATYVANNSVDTNVKKVEQSWPGTLTWNSKPDAGSTVHGTDHGAVNTWYQFDLTTLYQNMIDTDIGWTSHGIRLGGDTATPATDNYKEFASEETSITGADPQLYLYYNDPPFAPTLDTPPNNEVVTQSSPTLKITDPVADHNGDPVHVLYQISDTSAFTDIKASSGWIPDQDSWTVPAGILRDGQTYYWRVKSWDVCDPDNVGYCNLMGRPNPVSGYRQFTVTLDHFGADPKWPMWSDELGNGMSLNVNEAAGNLFLDVPLDSLSTAAGTLDFGLSYNHQDQDPEANGLGAGWALYAGPGADPRDLPIKLKTADDESTVKIYLRDGDKLFFTEDDNGSGTDFYTGSGAAIVKKNKDDTWLYTTPSGSAYTFGADKKLSGANVQTNLDATKGFTYLFSANSHLKEVTDPLGRKVTFTWDASDAKLTSISTWDGRSWSVAYDPTLTDMVRTITTPANEVLEFNHDPTTRDVTWVEDGENRRTEVGYVTPPAPATKTQVAWVQHPGYGSGDRTEFTYVAPYTGQLAAQAQVKDPRWNDPGVPSGSYITTMDFDKGGLPIRISGPANNLGFLPITSMVWDTNGNLVCKRGAAANAVDATKCTATNSASDPLQTDYAYDTEEPYRLLSITGPAPNPDGTGPRPVTTYAYDASWAGLYTEKYDNDKLSGVPTHREIQTTVNQNWGAGHPSGLTGDDTFSLRWTGYLHIATQKKYRFKLWSNDGVTLQIGKSVLLDCFGNAQETYDYNCGMGTYVSKQMYAGKRYRIAILYQEKTGNARIEFKWDAGTGGASYEIVPSSVLTPDMGVLTSETTPLGETITYNHSNDDYKVRRLPSSVTRSGTGVTSRTTTYTYDSYGRILTDANAAGTLTNTFKSDATTNCLEKVVDRTGAETTYVCNGAGDVTKITQKVRATGPQPLQNRVTDQTYDGVGRPKTVVTNDGSFTRTITTDYFADGALKEVRDTDGTTTRTTNYTYDSAGRLQKETLPDPDGGGPLTSPVIEHTYDQVGNELTMKDARGKIWTKAYDASNRVISSSNPIPSPNTATTTWIYDDTGQDAGDAVIGRPAGVLGVSTVWVTDPIGVKTYTKSDLLGRKISEQAGSRAQPATLLAATLYEYDVAGNVTKVTDPTGVWTRSEYNMFSELKKTIARTGTGGAEKETIYVYDDAGRLDTVTDARNKVTDYGYDGAGRITSVLPPGLLAGEVAWALVYDDAGELVRITDPNGRVRDFTFDLLGQASTYTETRAAGYVCPRSGTNVCVTTYHYNGFGELTSADDPRNITLNFVYDNLGRRTQRSAGGGVDQETYAYDPAGNMTQASNATATVAMTYDDAGRLDVVTQGSNVTDHTYDANGFKGLLTSRADPAGTTTISYDNYGRLSSITDPLTAAATTYTFDSAGRPLTRVDPAGITTTRAYGTPYTGRALTETVKDSAQATLASFTWGYDEVGNVLSAAQTIGSNADNGTWTYTYDDQNRLKTAQLNSNPTTTYGYDGAGNRTSVQVGSNPAVTTSYDTAGLPVSSSDGSTYTHDAAGNMTSVSGSRNWNLAYDSWSRIKSATGAPTPSILYAHDALDRMHTRTWNGVPTAYSYLGLSEDVAQEAVLGLVPTSYAWGPGGPLASRQGPTVRVFEQNLHGDLALIASPTGSVAGTQAYTPYGEEGATTGETARFGFQSDPTDADTGFVDMGARLYDPVLGRFTSRDPLFGEAQAPMSLNRYVYGWDNPVSNGDPNGLYCINYGEAVRCNDATSGSDKPTKSTYYPSSSYSRGSSASPSATPAPPPVPPVPRPFWIEVNAPPQQLIDHGRVRRMVGELDLTGLPGTDPSQDDRPRGRDACDPLETGIINLCLKRPQLNTWIIAQSLASAEGQGTWGTIGSNCMSMALGPCLGGLGISSGWSGGVQMIRNDRPPKWPTPGDRPPDVGGPWGPGMSGLPPGWGGGWKKPLLAAAILALLGAYAYCSQRHVTKC
jgi:RHS repeat-associated protein